jgi:hypothetical protein
MTLVPGYDILAVMPGQKARSAVFAPDVPGIHVFLTSKTDVDGRNKFGHDE